ncbi:MAG: transcriptional repressor [Veillonella sp.]|nr:transcriptional repressor [Veillonella sp.]MCF0155779.1 transcriptional repressor [Veillonella sp.]
MDIVDTLRSNGYKVTPQRLAVWNAIDGTRTHPTAEMIYQTVYPENPTMSLATVYKTLDIFAKIGLVKVLDVGNDSSHYDWDTHNHSHIRCLVCNRVDDVVDIDMAPLEREVAQMSSYEVTGQQITFEGICPDCRNKDKH